MIVNGVVLCFLFGFVSIYGASETDKCGIKYCEKVKCPSTEHCKKPRYKLVEMGSKPCGCCDTCVKQLGVGELCMKPKPLYEFTPNAECAGALRCDVWDTGLCIYNCAKDRDWLLKKYYWHGLMFPGGIPSCEEDGSYAPLRCETDQCFCVTKDGVKTGHVMRRDNWQKKFQCKCAREYVNLQRKDSPRILACEENGSYSRIQCERSGLCHCVDKYTGQKTSRHFPIYEKDDTDCDELEETGSGEEVPEGSGGVEEVPGLMRF